jgi:L,D-transpeptidase ErfK/SrfK
MDWDGRITSRVRPSVERSASIPPPSRRRLLAAAAGMAALTGTRPLQAALLGDLAPAAGEPAGPLPLRGDVVGQIEHLITDGRQTLVDLALERDLGILAISALNPGVDVWIPGRERLVALPTSQILPEHERRGIVVNLAELRLYHFPSPDTVPHVHAIGIGREGFTTPLGTTTVTRKQADPTWYPTEATRADRPELPSVVPAGPDNPLGRHAIYLGFPTYLIHGTNKPYGVGRRVSRGCIRMYPVSVASLFDRVPVGTPVRIMNDPIKLGWSNGDLFLEAHPDLEQLDELEAQYEFTKKPAPDIAPRIVAKAGEARDRLAWEAIEMELVSRRGVPVRITRPELASSSSRHRSTIPSDFIRVY